MTLVFSMFFGSVFSGKGNKSKNKQMGPHQTKKFSTGKKTINKIKRQSTELKKSFLISRFWYSKYIKNSYNWRSKKNNPVEKWSEDLKRHFSREDVQITNSHVKKYSTSLIIREMQIKSTMRYYFLPIRMAYYWKDEKQPVLARMPQKGLSCTVGGNLNWSRHYGKHYGGSSKN